MPITIPSDELAFLNEVERIGLSGKNQAAIADELKIPLPTLRSRVSRRGFQLVPSTLLRTTIGGQSLTDLMRQGEIVAADPSAEPEPAA